MSHTAYAIVVGVIGSALGIWMWRKNFSTEPVDSRGVVIFSQHPNRKRGRLKMAVQFSQGLRRWLPAFCVIAAVVALASLLVLMGCRPGVLAVDSATPAHPKASLSGTVRALEGRPTIEGRIVEAINVDTGERRRQTTRRNGGYTFKLNPGEYRIELVLRPGEALTSQPGIVDLNERVDDAHADFVIGAPRVVLPSDPSRYTGSSLGPPIA